MAHIVIDVREAKILKFFENDPTVTNCTSKQLPIGDIILVNPENEADTLAIIERKTVADLAASLKDGRWHEQKLRLKQERNTTGAHIVYVIEGNMTFNEAGMLYGLPAKALVTMVMKTMFKDGLQVVFTRTVLDTCDFVCGLAKRVMDFTPVASADENNSSSQNAPDAQHEQHVSTFEKHQDALIRAKKRENVTGATIFAMQLCAIPGISPKKAAGIREHLKVECMADLVRELQAFETEKATLKKLITIPGVGKILAADIYRNIIGVDST